MKTTVRLWSRAALAAAACGMMSLATPMASAQSGMDEEIITRDMGKHQSEQEVFVCLGKAKALAVGLFTIEVAVACQRSIPTIEQKRIATEIRIVGPTKEIEKHRFVVSEQKYALVVLPKLDQTIDHTRRIGPAINVVAEEDQAVASLERHHIEKLIELFEFTMNIANRVEHVFRMPALSRHPPSGTHRLFESFS